MGGDDLTLLRYIALTNDYNEYSKGHQYKLGDIVVVNKVQYISNTDKNLGSNPELLKNWSKIC
jgi:hypothetical protein